MQNQTSNLRQSLLLSGVALLATSALTSAQVRQSGAPAGFELPFADHVPTVEIPTPDVARLMSEDANRQGPGPLRFGVLVPAAIDFSEMATWDLSDDATTLVGRLRLTSPGARSLGLEFARYDLPEAGRVFVYDDLGATVYGAYSQRNRIPTGEFVVEPFPGDTAILEYSQPAHVEGLPTIVLRGVIHDYTGFFDLERGLNETNAGGDGGCTVFVNCPEGDPFELEKRATVRTIYQGGLCSGVLLNNTAQDGTQFLYTANHCGTGSTVNVRFNYQSAGCSGGGPTNQNVSGAVLLDNDQDTDGRLLRITNQIPSSYNPYYAGWSRSNENLTFGMSMHHPAGGPKEISIDSNGGGKGTAGFIGIGTVKVWFMDFDIGGTEGGSSGGPLWDENRFVRGVLTGGPSGDCVINRYGRFNPFWVDDDLGEHLDPLGLGVTELGGMDPNNPLNPPTITSVTPASFASVQGGVLSINGVDLNAATSVQIGSQVFAGNELSSVNAFMIELDDPLMDVVGTVPVTVTNGVGTSNSVNVTITDNDPPVMFSQPVSVPGIEWRAEWGGLSQDVYFMNWALDDSTIPVSGFDVLANGNFGISGTLSLGGTDEFVIPSPGSLGFLTLYFQLLTFDSGGAGFVGSSNISSTLFL